MQLALEMRQEQEIVSDKDGNIPVIGMGLTVQMYTDRVTYTIVSVSPSGKSFKAVRDNVVRIDTNEPYSDSQEYAYSPGTGEQVSFRLGSKTGRFKCKIGYASLGVRRHYHDPSF